MRAVPAPAAAVAAGTPAVYDLLGYQFEIAPMALALAACVVVRIYKGAKAKDRQGWIVDVSISVLMVLVTFALVATARPGLILATILGTGLGGIGAGFISYAEKKAGDALGMDDTPDDPVSLVGDNLRAAHPVLPPTEPQDALLWRLPAPPNP